MITEKLKEALEELKAERDRIDSVIQALEASMGSLASSSPRRGVKKKAPRGSSRKRAPRGLLKEKIHQVLAASKTPLTAAVLRDRVVTAGYPMRDPKTLYTSVFVAASKDPKVKKTKSGFALRARAAGKKVTRAGRKKTK